MSSGAPMRLLGVACARLATASLLPGFGSFAGWYLLCAAMFLFVGFETRGKGIEALDAEIEQQRTGRRSNVTT